MKEKVFIVNEETNEEKQPKAAIKEGKLDMVIAFDTTGSMSAYIEDVKKHVKELIPELLNTNPDLMLSIVAFGDYCDMESATEFGKAYQCIDLTRNGNDLVDFTLNAQNTSGGDSDEFYELVLHKILTETKWRPDANKNILLIADAQPHSPGYSYTASRGGKDLFAIVNSIASDDSDSSYPSCEIKEVTIVENSQYDWRQEAYRAKEMGVEIDTLSLCFYGKDWYKELSEITNGVYSQFKSSHKTTEFVKTAAWARGGETTSAYLYNTVANCADAELRCSAATYMCKNVYTQDLYDKDIANKSL